MVGLDDTMTRASAPHRYRCINWSPLLALIPSPFVSTRTPRHGFCLPYVHAHTRSQYPFSPYLLFAASSSAHGPCARLLSASKRSSSNRVTKPSKAHPTEPRLSLRMCTSHSPLPDANVCSIASTIARTPSFTRVTPSAPPRPKSRYAYAALLLLAYCTWSTDVALHREINRRHPMAVGRGRMATCTDGNTRTSPVNGIQRAG